MEIEEKQHTPGGAWSLYIITIVTILRQVVVNIPTTPITIQIRWQPLRKHSSYLHEAIIIRSALINRCERLQAPLEEYQAKKESVTSADCSLLMVNYTTPL